MPFASRPSLHAWRMRRANEVKAWLIAQLGGRCAHCGSAADLEINHIFGRDWTPRKLTHYRRVMRYKREFEMGLVNLLCQECNSRYRPGEADTSSGAGEPF